MARRIRAARPALQSRALKAALTVDPSLDDRYDEVMLRRFVRDYERHIEQLARAIETGEQRFVTTYGETLVPVYRRRDVRMNDVVSLLRGLEEATVSVVGSTDHGAVREVMAAWIERMRHHRRLPGDHDGNAAVRFVWKGGGLGDDTVV